MLIKYFQESDFLQLWATIAIIIIFILSTELFAFEPPIAGLSLSPPVQSKTVSGGYAEYDTSVDPNNPFHAGIDYSVYKVEVRAAHAGSAVLYQLDDNDDMTNCLGNVVIIKHDSGYSTLYAHLTSISLIGGSPILDSNNKYYREVATRINPGDLIGVSGETAGNKSNGAGCNSGTGVWPFHLHFELKENFTLGSPTDSSLFSYTPSHPDNYGYHDPILNLHEISALQPTTFAYVTNDGNEIKLRFGPNSAYEPVIKLLHPGESYKAISSSTATDKCTSGWLQLQPIDASRFNAHYPTAWSCRGHIYIDSGTGSLREDSWLITGLPEVPSGPVPADNETLSQPLKLDWSFAQDAESYDVYLDGSRSGSDLTISEWTINSTLSLGTHTWQVFPKNSLGVTTGPLWEFNISNQCVSISEPSANSTIIMNCGSLPTATTNSADNITQTSARLRMTANPGGASTNVYFIWEAGDTTPDAFQTQATNIGGGTTDQAYSYTISNLSCNTNYYFKANASNTNGSDEGVVLSFITDSCSGGGTHTEELIENGGFESGPSDFWVATPDFYIGNANNPNNGVYYAFLSNADWSAGNNLEGGLISQEFTISTEATSVAFEYWVRITTDDIPDDDYDLLEVYIVRQGNNLTKIQELSNRDETGSSYTRQRPTISSGFYGEPIQLFFRGATDPSFPTVFRIDDVSLEVEVPDGGPPSATTLDATNITDSRAEINARINPNQLETDVWFDFEANDSTPNDQTVHTNIGSGSSVQDFSLTMTGLECGTRYYFEANAKNNAGDDNGTIKSFRTDDCPTTPPKADTDPARDITRISARLTAEILPNGLATDAWFEWGTSPGLGNSTSHQGVGSGQSWVDFDSTLSGLECATQYYYEAHAQNTDGKNDGSTHTFATLDCPVNQPPSITVLGNNPLILDVGRTYIDPGVTASDPEDGDLTNIIVVSGDAVDTNTEGTYFVTYGVTDSGGLYVSAERKVQVIRRENLIFDDGFELSDDIP